MSVQPSLQESSIPSGPAPAAASLMRRHRIAQANLEKAYESRKPVALMVGPDNFELGRVIGVFLGGLDNRTTCVRLRQPQENALAALGEITRAIGFEPKDLTVSDLQHVIAMFLEYQGNHGHRTVLCVEKADQQSMWLLDCIARMIKSSASSAVGRNLFVVISGTSRVIETLENAAFEVIRREAGTPLRLSPFSVFETREFVRQISETAGLGDIQSIFEFDALERLHRISGGIPFVVARLFRECVAIIRKTNRPTATAKVVVKAARNLRAASQIDEEIGSPPLVHVRQAERNARRLLIRCPKIPQQEFPLHAGRFMIGRASTADIRLSSASVSRRHALLIDTGKDAQVLDLGGMNGTFDGSERIAETVLSPGTVLTLGDCQIEYAVD